MTTLACVIGWPVAHSLSPAIHNAAFAAAGLDWTFMPVAIRPGAIGDGMALLDELGAVGVSVTMPHKAAVVPFMTRLDPVAARLGVVNTIVRTDRGLVGHNTDGAGFLHGLARGCELDPGGAAVTILGAGGAARAVAVALADAGAVVTVVARRDEQAAAVAGLHAAITPARTPPADADLVVDATPARDQVPFGLSAFGRVAVDLTYGSEPSAFLRAAAAAGASTLDGLGMLIGQAAAAFELWTGVTAPIEAMETGARDALASRVSDMSGQAS